VAIHAAWSKHKKEVDGLDKRLLDILRRAEPPSTRIDPKNLDLALAEIRKQKDLNRQEIESIQRLIKALEPELKDLRAEIDRAKLDRLKDRVDKLGKGKSGR
jgi:DNA-binding transcriptional MerR regulator